jgi:hypothetical protein
MQYSNVEEAPISPAAVLLVPCGHGHPFRGFESNNRYRGRTGTFGLHKQIRACYSSLAILELIQRKFIKSVHKTAVCPYLGSDADADADAGADAHLKIENESHILSHSHHPILFVVAGPRRHQWRRHKSFQKSTTSTTFDWRKPSTTAMPMLTRPRRVMTAALGGNLAGRVEKNVPSTWKQARFALQ